MHTHSPQSGEYKVAGSSVGGQFYRGYDGNEYYAIVSLMDMNAKTGATCAQQHALADCSPRPR